MTVDMTDEDFDKLFPIATQPKPVTNRLFVYGIFLAQPTRDSYGMTNAQYATVPDFATFGGHIVQAAYIEGAGNLQLTGLTVDVDPANWTRLDRLESGYDRVIVTTTMGEDVYMYVTPGTKGK